MTNLEIVNRALRYLGATAASSMSDTAKNAAAAISAYTLARDEMLRAIMPPSCVLRLPMKDMAEQASPWAADTRYFVGDRCTNDTAKTYVCTTAGTSDSSGGPTGTDDAIDDNTVVWGYVEASTASNNWSWITLTAYLVGDLVTADVGKVYVCTTAGTTGATAPSGTDDDQSDGTVVWDYYTTPGVNYSTLTYRYILPYECIRALKVPDAAATDEHQQGVQYIIEGRTVFCSQQESTLKYVRREEDPNLWDTLTQEVVSLKICAEIAHTVTGKASIAREWYEKFAVAYGNAKMIALNESGESPVDEALWIDT